MALAVVPAVVLLAGMITVPESPRWLAANGYTERAFKVLGKIRTEKDMDKASFKDLKIPWIRRIVFLGIGLGIM